MHYLFVIAWKKLYPAGSMRLLIGILFIGFALASYDASATTLQVGPKRAHGTLASALKAARNGDVIEVDAGVYRNQAVTVSRDDLTIRGIGGLAHFRWVDGAIVNGKGIFVIRGTRVTLESLEISGARVDDGNGAGIRVEPNSVLAVRDCYVHDNENGLLTSNDRVSSVAIENSEFARNGSGTGQTHNIYVGAIDSFSIRFSYSHLAHIGHNVKSRARKNYISYNRIMDESDGDSSYLIDIPNGGETYVIGNLLQKGSRADNPTLVSYGAEGFVNPGWTTRIYVVNNTFVSDYGPGTNFIFVRSGASAAEIVNNIFSGSGKTVASSGTRSFWSLKSNLKVDGDPGFRSLAEYDYRLTSGATWAIDKGIDPGSANGVSLMPGHQYVHPLKSARRVKVGPNIDIGAYEYMEQSLP